MEALRWIFAERIIQPGVMETDLRVIESAPTLRLRDVINEVLLNDSRDLNMCRIMFVVLSFSDVQYL